MHETTWWEIVESGLLIDDINQIFGELEYDTGRERVSDPIVK
jgi:hypothetical protein